MAWRGLTDPPSLTGRITPAVGYVGAPAALAVGALTAAAANLSTGLKHILKVDDAVDAGALHAIGGIWCVRFSSSGRDGLR